MHLERKSILSITSKYKGTRDVITIHREMPTHKAYSEISIENGNEKMLQDEKGESGLLSFFDSSSMSESLRLRRRFMWICPKYLCQKDGVAYFIIPQKILTTEDGVVT